MNPLELLSNAQQSDELRRTISTAALLWAACSIIVIIMEKIGWVTSYDDALPFVILLTWIGSEVVARLPGRTPIAICENCARTQILPRTLFRRFWPWKRCIVCGGHLKYCCQNKHLLSLFTNEGLPTSIENIWCSRCGEPSRALSSKKYFDYLSHLISLRPDKNLDNAELARSAWLLIKGTELEEKLKEPFLKISEHYLAAKYGQQAFIQRPTYGVTQPFDWS